MWAVSRIQGLGAAGFYRQYHHMLLKVMPVMSFSVVASGSSLLFMGTVSSFWDELRLSAKVNPAAPTVIFRRAWVSR